jgi:DNA adenine methylase
LLVRYLVDLVPEQYDYYCEPFFGGGSMLFRLQPAMVETVNDINGDLMHLYRVLRDRQSFREFLHMATYTLHSRALFEECRDGWRQETDPVRRAWAFWVTCRQSYCGDLSTKGWKYSIEHNRRHMSKETMALLATIRALPQIHERLQRVQIECADALRVIESYSTRRCLLYVDPPYHLDTRTQYGRYDYEMDSDQHADLVEVLLRTDALVMVSGYQHETYAALDRAGWDRWERKTACQADTVGRRHGRQRRQLRLEIVWRNYRNRDGQVVRLETRRDVTVPRPWRVEQQMRMFATTTETGTETV